MNSFVERAPFVLFFAAVILITRLYGRGPGIATLVLAVAITDFFLIPPIYSFVPNVDEVYRIGTFTLLGILTIWIVSSLMQREKEARDSEARCRTLFDYSPDGIIITDTQGYYLDANESICRLLGHTRDELIGRHVSELVADDEIPHIGEALKAAGSGSEHYKEWTVKRKDGSTLLIESSATQMPDGNLLGVIRDVSERKRSQAKIRESESRLSGIIESAMDAIITIDDDQKIVLFNHAAEGMFRCSAADAIGDSIERFIPQRFRPAHSTHVRKFGETRVTTRSMRSLGGIFGLRSDGEEFPIEASISQVETGGKRFFTVILRDITERKITEALNARLAAIVTSSDDAIVGKDLTGIVTSWNTGAEKIFGYTSDEMIGQPITRLFPPDRLSEEDDILAKLRQGKPTGHFETKRLRKDGTLIDLSITVSPIKDASGNVIGASKVARDITERNLAQTALRESEKRRNVLAKQLQIEHEQLHEAQTVAKMGSWETDFETLATTWSEETYRIFGINPGSFHPSHHGFLGLVHPEDRPAVEKAFADSTGRVGRFSIEHRILHQDGRTKFVEEAWQTHVGDNGVAKRAVGSCQDITERKQAEQALRQSEELFATAFDQAPIGIGLVSPDGRWLKVNRSLAQLVGYSESELLKLTFSDITHTDDREESLENLRRVLDGEVNSFSSEKRYLHSKGNVITVRLDVASIRDQQGQPLYLIGQIQDITDRKQAEETIRQLTTDLERRVVERTEQLESANRELESFSYSVSHDLRAPLRHIDGFTKLLVKREAAKLDTKSAHYLDVISGSVGKMGVLIDELLTFSRTTRQELKLDSVDLNLLIKDSMEMLEPARSIVWKVESLPIVEGDKTLLGIVLTNLLSNAIKYSRHRDEAIIEIGLSEEDDSTATVYVRDNGAGFDMQYADRLFGV
ncbi:MAG: PAS domain S-box protein, partial [Pyrinomonadaceae bacterium]